MKIVVCTSKEDAQKLSDDVDRANGLPWSGIEHDTGRIVPNQTMRMNDILEHATDKTVWAYPDTAEMHDDPKGGEASVKVPTGSRQEDFIPDPLVATWVAMPRPSAVPIEDPIDDPVEAPSDEPLDPP